MDVRAERVRGLRERVYGRARHRLSELRFRRRNGDVRVWLVPRVRVGDGVAKRGLALRRLRVICLRVVRCRWLVAVVSSVE